MDGVAIERRLREFFETRAAAEGIAAAWLFGSFAGGTPRARSLVEAGADLTVGVLFKEPPSPKTDEATLRQRRELDMALGLTAWIVVLNGCEWLETVFGMLQDQHLLVEGDRSQRVAFEVRARNEFWDFEPYLKLYRSKNPR
jgi:hypothetical protein